MKAKPRAKKPQAKKTKSKFMETMQDDSSWVHRVLSQWVPVDSTLPPSSSSPSTLKSESESESNCTTTLSIISWNVLADSYCSPRSHRHLPLVYQRHVFNKELRLHHVRQLLQNMATGTLQPDVFALQEVDPPLELEPCMKKLGYLGYHSPFDPACKDGRVDSCVLYYRQDKWKATGWEYVRLDDLAIQCSKNHSTNECSHNGQNSNTHSNSLITTSTTRGSLHGIQAGYIRKNMALLVGLENLVTKQQVVIAVVHLFWNPQYPDVKLCQTHQIALRAKQFAKGVPVIFVGDTNSQPQSAVYQYLSQGFVNAKQVAPWYNIPSSPTVEQEAHDSSKADDSNSSNNCGLEKGLEAVHLTNAGNSDTEAVANQTPPPPPTTTTPQVRYLLDFSLNRLCRWLRILGIDAGLETEEEEHLRTRESIFRVFDRCREERRSLVTTSTRLMRRRDCPPGTYLLDTQALSNLEVSLVHLLLSHGVVLEPQNFLSRCVVCNGDIKEVHGKEDIQAIFEAHQAPASLNDEKLEVFQCVSCGQGYWYDERPNSSASRVKNQATKLLEMCIRGGVPLSGDMAMFSFVDPDEILKNRDPNAEECQLLDQRLDILEWLQSERLENPLGALQSAYGSPATTSNNNKNVNNNNNNVHDGQELLSFTNVTHDFVGHLDYIFHPPSLRVIQRLYVPTSFEELNDRNLRNGHLLPSNKWPSDHLAIGATFEFLHDEANKEKKEAFSSSNKDTQSSTALLPPQSKVALSQTDKAASSENDPNEPLFCFPLAGDASSSIPPPPPPPPPGLMSVPPPPPLPQQQHNQRCDCGCVPMVPSLFEMAELRRQARMKSKS